MTNNSWLEKMENSSSNLQTVSLHPTVEAMHGPYIIFTTVMTYTTNTIALLILPYTKGIPKNSRLFFMSLSIANFGNGIPIALATYAFYVGYFPFPVESCKLLSSSLFMTFYFVSMNSLLALNIERYIAIKKPLKYLIIVTTTRIRCVNGIIWIIGILLGPVIYIWGPPTSYNTYLGICGQNFEGFGHVERVFLTLPFVLPSLMMIYIYIYLLRITHSQIKAIQLRQPQVMATQVKGHCKTIIGHCTFHFTELRNLTTFLAITVVNLLVWLPFFIILTIYESGIPHTIFIIQFWCACLGNWLNMVILMGTNSKCRHEVLDLLKSKRCLRKQ